MGRELRGAVVSEAFDAALDAYAYDHHLDVDDGGWLGDGDEDVGPPGDWGDDETLQERNERILRRDAATRQADRPGGVAGDPRPIERAPRPEVRGRRLLATDAATARAFIRGREVALGLGAGELLARPRRGRPTPEAQRRRVALAGVLAELREMGATLELLAAASGQQLSVVHGLLSLATKSESQEVEGV
jgi:hypothetical protein